MEAMNADGQRCAYSTHHVGTTPAPGGMTSMPTTLTGRDVSIPRAERPARRPYPVRTPPDQENRPAAEAHRESECHW
jgi:hypothetical protein